MAGKSTLFSRLSIPNLGKISNVRQRRKNIVAHSGLGAETNLTLPCSGRSVSVSLALSGSVSGLWNRVSLSSLSSTLSPLGYCLPPLAVRVKMEAICGPRDSLRCDDDESEYGTDAVVLYDGNVESVVVDGEFANGSSKGGRCGSLIRGAVRGTPISSPSWDVDASCASHWRKSL